jgi:ubiquinone/menaquinone biosynthesis C-methylase UbiE
MNDLRYILPGEPIPRGSLFHERRYRVAQTCTDNMKTGRLLLDIGCGNASQTEYFADHVNLAVGVDLQVARLPGFRDELEDKYTSKIAFIGGSGDFLPIQKEVFDYVTCFEVLEHVRDETATLSEIYRVLKPGGELIMSVPHRWWIFETHGADLPVLPWNRVPFFSWLPKPIHDRWARARIYTEREIKIITEKAGFAAINTELLTAPMDVVKNVRIQNLLRKLIFRGDTTRVPLLASTIFVHARKNA